MNHIRSKMRYILFLIFIGCLGLVLLYALDQINPHPNYYSSHPVIWFSQLESLGRWMANACVVCILVGSILLVVAIAWKAITRINVRRKESLPAAVQPEVVYGESLNTRGGNLGIKAMPSLSARPLETGSVSPVVTFFTLSHTLLKWFTGLNILMAISILSMLILYFTARILFGEGFEAINEFKSR